MSKFISEPKADDVLSMALDAAIDGSFLLIPECPRNLCTTLLHKKYGICIVSLSSATEVPSISEAGAPEGVDVDDLVRSLKVKLGRASAALPVAHICWYPEIPLNSMVPRGMKVSMLYGFDMDIMQPFIINAMTESSTPPGNAFSAMEAELRASPGSKPAVSATTHSNISVTNGAPMASTDPMLLLIGHSISAVIGNSEAEIMNTSLTPMDLSAPDGLLPVILVIAAEEWGAADLASDGKGGFHVYLTSTKEAAGSITGYAVSDVQASSAVVMSLSITTTLKSCRNSEGKFILDGLVSRFARFMEIGGFSSMNMKRLKLALRNLGED